MKSLDAFIAEQQQPYVPAMVQPRQVFRNTPELTGFSEKMSKGRELRNMPCIVSGTSFHLFAD